MIIMSENKNSLAKNMLWNTIGNLVYSICQWVMTILVVRIDSYGSAGILSIAMSTSSTFSTIAMFSMRNYQVSDLKQEFHDAEYLGSRIITCIGAMIMCSIYAISSSSIYQMLCIDAFMLIRIAESIVDVIHGIDQKYNRYDIIGKSFLIRGIATDVTFIGGYLFFNSLLFSLILVGITNTIIVIMYDIRKTEKLEKLSFIINDKHILTLFKKCTPIVITSFALSMIPLVSKTTIQNFLGNDVLGVYSSIASPTLVVQIFATYAFNPLIPRIAKLYMQKKYDEFLQAFHKILLIFVIFSLITCLGAILLGRFGLKILYGDSILSSYYLFMPLVCCTIFTALIWIMNSIVTSIRKITPMMITVIVGFIICFLFSNYFVNIFGANGASYIQVLCYILILIVLLLIVLITIRKDKRRMQNK